MTDKISPSMMCADITSLTKTLDTFEKCGIEYLHIDIMDGHFVPNFTLGTDYCKAIKKICNIPLDIHLMIEKPEEKLSWFQFGEGDIVSVHAESTAHLQKALAQIKKCGAKAFVALNPSTPICVLDYILDDIDGVMIMAVNPGFAGQKMVPSCLEKISYLRSYLDGKGYSNVEIEVDGNVSFENAVKMKKAGANIFVAGTSSVFNKDFSLEDGIALFRQKIGEA
ncbi:MAG: ribulose-phosphate 3-epimerase [Clostridia bacterium]|nr:ribulose-phosphate 3-epimerase [Clostridia bacterium]